MGRRERRSRRGGRHSKNKATLSPWAIGLIIAAALAVVVYGGWLLLRGPLGKIFQTTTSPTAQITTGGATQMAPSTPTVAASEQGTLPEETTTTTALTTTASAQTPAAEPSAQRTLALVGWALIDRHPDGFHSKYLEREDMGDIIKAAMTLANQNELGFALNLEKTDDPTITMVSSNDANSLLAALISGASLSGSDPAGDLTPMGDGWAAQLPSEKAVVPAVYIVDTEDTDDGQLLSFVLVQPSAQGEEVLQTAMAEVRRGEGAYGYQVISWVTQDVPRFTKKSGNEGVTLSANVSQSVSALEIRWGDGATGDVTVTVEGQSKTVAATPGKLQVIPLDKAAYTEKIVVKTGQPDQLQQITAY